MSKKEKLQKALAVSLMLTNIFCAPVWAADPVKGTPGPDGTSIIKNEDISGGISGASGEYTADNGTPGGNASGGGTGGKGGDGGSVNVNDTVSGTIGGAIAITATGGDGALGGAGHDSGNNDEGPRGINGDGGSSKVVISVAGSSMTTSNDISVTVKAGSGYKRWGDSETRNADIDGRDGGKGGEAAAIGLQADNKSTLATITAADITITAVGGDGAGGDSSYRNGGVGGAGGAAEAYGLSAIASLLTLDINDIKVEATGGNGSYGGTGGSSGYVGNGGAAGAGGTATAWGINSINGAVSGSINSITAEATGGKGQQGGLAMGINSDSNIKNGASSVGGGALVYAISSNNSKVDLLTTTDITAKSTGGAGGAGTRGDALGSGKGITGYQGADGGDAAAYGIKIAGSETSVSAVNLLSTATGGAGGEGGEGGEIKADNVGSAGGDGGSGGNGGDANAYAAYADKGRLQLTVDTVTATAMAGSGGDGGTGCAKKYQSMDDLRNATPGSKGMAGSAGNAAAYGIYAINGSLVDLQAKSGDTVTIAATATDGIANEAYAVYAVGSKVNLLDNVEITDGTTFLNNSVLAFADKTADRKLISGSTLQLEGSNTFRVATDLANNKADSFKFESLAGSSTATQYITVGYDKSFDGSKLDCFSGDVTVLTVEDLKGQSLNFVGKESEMDNPLTRFLATPTVEVSAVDNGGVVKITQIDFKEDGASETVLTVADAQMSIANLWRVEGNNLMKRMGELRSDPEAAEGGVWARYYRGEMSADSAYDRSFDQDYTAFQGGIDKMQDYKGGKLYTGIAVNRIDSNANYLAGSGDLSSTGVGVYASWLGNKGHYLDVIARGSKLANDFKLVDKNGREANADYDTWAYGISAEYGYRQNLNAGWFVEPQAELSLGLIGSADYTTSNGVSIKQDAVNSAVTRLGVLSGKEFTMNGRQGNVYLKASLLHDFGGNGGGAAYYNDRSTVVESADMNGTWYEIGLGANLGLAKNSNLYFDALKTFGGDLRTDWQFNAGLRFTF